MKRKKLVLTETFMMISNWNKPFGLHGLYKNSQVSWDGLQACFFQSKISNSNCTGDCMVTWNFCCYLIATSRRKHLNNLLQAYCQY